VLAIVLKCYLVFLQVNTMLSEERGEKEKITREEKGRRMKSGKYY